MTLHSPVRFGRRGFRGVTTQASTLTPGLAGVRARIAEQTREAKRLAFVLNLEHRNGLRYMAGSMHGLFMPTPGVIDKLVADKLVHESDPAAWRLADRYRPTDLGAEVLGLIGVRG